MTTFREYVEHGWALCPLRPGTKQPTGKDWNRKANAMTVERAGKARGAGLMHSYSGTMALDIDDYAAASDWLAERGISLSDLISAPDAVQLVSGREGRGKLLYACPVPMASTKITEGSKTLLEFRCATANGLSVQDVLPPSIHPETGKPYRWVFGDPLFGDWRSLPELPVALRDVWEALLASPAPTAGTAPPPIDAPAPSAALDELRELLTQHNPDAAREEWIKVGAALHHETQGSPEGLALWDEWSRKSEKYKGPEDLEKDWRSFRSDKGVTVTAGYLRQTAVATADEFEDVSNTTQAEDDPWAAVERERLSKFAPVHISEVVKRPPPDWLIKNVLPQADLAMIYGEPGAGKSFVALDIAFAIATGEEWAKIETGAGPVVWLAAEAAGSIRLRARAYARQHGLILDHAELWVMDHPISLMSVEDSEALGQALVETEPRMIIVDTLAAASGGANENSGEDMNTVLNNCRALHAATGALVLLVHHSGKDAAKGARGWSGLKAAMQTELLVTNVDGQRWLAVTKQRDAADGDAWPIDLIPIMLDEETESCYVQTGPIVRRTKERTPSKLKGVKAQVWRALNDLELVNEGGVLIDQLYALVLEQLPPPPAGTKRDQRKGNVQRALRELIEQDYARLQGDLVYRKEVEENE